jgi:hypothetical protein
MEDSAFTDEFCRFIQTALPSVDAAELLLLLRRHRDSAWSLQDALAALRPSVSMSDAEAAKCVETFRARGLVAVGDERRVQYQPSSDALDEHVGTLERAYQERPVTLIRMIYALRDTKIQTFADAFKIRKS